jgi:hypothetical protein
MNANVEQIHWQTFVTCVDLGERVCRLASCRTALPRRRTAYCSDKHAREFERNQVWFASPADALPGESPH